MASTDDHSSNRCVLSKCICDGGSADAVQAVLWKSVWEYMTPHRRRGDTPVSSDSPWPLAGCALTGCLETMSFLLHAVVRRNECETKELTSTTSTTQLINQRSSCAFPLPDSWVNKCVSLAVSPLHLACWRLDLRMIQILLRLGADPKSLALEKCTDLSDSSNEQLDEFDVGTHTETVREVDESSISGNSTPFSELSRTHSQQNLEEAENLEENASVESTDSHAADSPQHKSRNEPRKITVDGDSFYINNGLSPLDFVVLGVRCPPKYSFELASRHGVIHDIKNTCFGNMVCSRGFKSTCSDSDCAICHGFRSQDDENISINYDEDFDDTKKELMINKCLELLISAGANPNEGSAKCLSFRYPLDILIQPPIDIYYGPMMGRSTQIAVNIRRYNLGNNVPYVTSACRVMISHNARLSPSFISLFRWKPKYIDCFAIDSSSHTIELIKIISRLGLFSDQSSASVPIQENAANFLGSESNEDIQYPLQKNMETFIADVVNNESPKNLVSAVLQCVSMSTIRLFCTLATRIIESSEFDLSYLSELVESVITNQMRSLVHSSMLVILDLTGTKQKSIHSLPIPNSLKRRLLFFDF